MIDQMHGFVIFFQQPDYLNAIIFRQFFFHRVPDEDIFTLSYFVQSQ